MQKILALIVSEIELRDVFAFGGLALLTCGAAQIYAPAGFIVPGLVLMVLGIKDRV